ncbi:ABC transporter permease [Engelhardtia mirabilis]|uniref:Transport permease protein n=1 Tax=Engelhardtia mirabilis TaxID=2528011 RepID=A0A518BI80_9BACT|nr:Teichoic acid translocation permease protein TagG [Planctomycetes bacterium Pla133]QDV01015.1 Teichoic acid translocation permease protein TagG [Planctomycetes bacterium Pla86]
MTPPPEAIAVDASDDGWITSDPPGPAHVVRRLVGLPTMLARHRDLIYTSVRRELEARFTGTLLGWLWPLVYPVFMFVVYYFIFARLLDLKLPDLPEGLEASMGIYMFTGILIWSGFGEGLVRATNVIVENGNLIKKLAFPTEILPLNMVLTHLVTMMFGVVAYVAVLHGSALFMETPIFPPPTAMLAWIPVLLLLQIVFTFGLGLLLATLQVFVRDTIQVTTLLVTIWMFITPIFWVANPEVMSSIEPFLDSLAFNPLYHLIYAWRVVLMSRQPEIAFVGEDSFIGSLGIFAVWSVAVFLVGYTFFVLSQRRFADEV